MDMTQTRVTLYRIATGEKRDFYPIDALRCIERGGWSETPVTAKPAPAKETTEKETTAKAETAKAEKK